MSFSTFILIFDIESLTLNWSSLIWESGLPASPVDSLTLPFQCWEYRDRCKHWIHLFPMSIKDLNTQQVFYQLNHLPAFISHNFFTMVIVVIINWFFIVTSSCLYCWHSPPPCFEWDLELDRHENNWKANEDHDNSKPLRRKQKLIPIIYLKANNNSFPIKISASIYIYKSTLVPNAQES